VFETLLLIFAGAYGCGILFFTIGAWLARLPYNRAYRPKVSVIIAARNEEHNIRRCLDAVIHLTYPRELLEVIVVNDRSTDATADITREYTARCPFLKLFNARPGGGNLHGKANALNQGIAVATGEIILMTDADCAVPAGWIEETVKYYTDGTVGIVPGFTAIRSRSLFEAMQTLDWFALFSVAAGANRLGFPVTAVGNNLSVRRAAYDHVGGYEGIPFSITEDYALFHAVTTTGKYSARFPLDRHTLVESEPCPSWRDLYRQRKRWFMGGRDMNFQSILMFAAAWVFHAGLLAGIIITPGLLVGIAVAIKIGADFLLSLPSLTRFRRWDLLPAFPLYELYYFAYVLVLPVVVLSGQKVIWKERSFSDGKMEQPS
jgi:cellulose synthase/poly-beta-1,6-N-acetylglucosamine synthase-like glycosyltransferase